MNDINNSTARIWTNAQLKQTVQQARAAKLEVTHQERGFTEIRDPDTGNIVLRSLQTLPGSNMVRYDQSYFDGSRKLVYVYIDRQLRVCYCNDRDSEANRNHTSWYRFEVPEKYLRTFMHYYELTFHPLTKKI